MKGERETVSAKVIDAMCDIAALILRSAADLNTVYQVSDYTFRKWENTGYGEDYLLVLFENELRDHVMRQEINAVGRMNYERNLLHTGAEARPA